MQCKSGAWISTSIEQLDIFRTHPDINTGRMIFNHELSIEWQVCTPPHFDLQYTQAMDCLNR